MRIVEVGRLSLVMLFVAAGLNSLGDPGCSCWGLVLQEEVRLVVGLSGGGGAEVAGPGGSEG